MRRAFHPAALTAALILVALPLSAQVDDSEPSSATDTSADGRTPPGDDLDKIVVTITGQERSRFETIQGTNVLSGDALRRETLPSLGDTLERQVGVTSTGFTPGASAPVIRGVRGPRVRVLQNGVSTTDASVSSDDHQVASEPLLADRIEVIRGAGTLRYGSNAQGGVVNVIDGRIPSRLPEDGYDAALESTYGTNQDERSTAGAANVAVPVGEGHMVFHGDGFIRRTHDLEVRGDVLSSDLRKQEGDAEGADTRGRVPNSDIRAQGGTGGFSYVFENGFFGAAYQRLESDYGVPVGHGEEEEEHGDEHGEEEEHGDEHGEEEGHGHGEEVRIDLKHNRFDLAGQWRAPMGPFDAVDFRGVYGDYQHIEREGGARGTIFTNRELEGRWDLTQAPWRGLEGVVGLQFNTRDFEAVGAEAFVPQTDTLRWALFAVEELALDPFTLEGGLRLERTEHDPSAGLSNADFTGVSTSLGASFSPDEDWLFGVSLSRTERAPSVEELFSDGPHLSTGGFEVGDPDLDEEIAWSAELTARKRLGPVTGAFNLFYTRYEDFIFQRNTGEIEDGLPVRTYTQRDAVFHGAELELAWTFYDDGNVTALVDLGADYVRGRERNGSDLPRIPPIRVRTGAEFRSSYVDGRIEVIWVDNQHRTADFEFPTSDHTLLNASLTFRPMPKRRPDLSFLLQGRNLTDERGRNHVSFLKDQLPIAGRDIRLTARLEF